MGGNFAHRWSQTREAILVMKELWTKEEAEYHGTFYDFPPGAVVSQGAAAPSAGPLGVRPVMSFSGWSPGAMAGCLYG